MRLVWNVTDNVIQIEFVRLQEAHVDVNSQARRRRHRPSSSFIDQERFISSEKQNKKN